MPGQWDGPCSCSVGHGVPPGSCSLGSSRPSLLHDERLDPVQHMCAGGWAGQEGAVRVAGKAQSAEPWCRLVEAVELHHQSSQWTDGCWGMTELRDLPWRGWEQPWMSVQLQIKLLVVALMGRDQLLLPF